MQPAVAQRLCGQVGLAVVAGHRDRAAPYDFAGFAGRQVAAVVADDPQLVEGRRHADAARLAQGVVAVEHGDESLGEAVQLVEAVRQQPVQPILVLAVQRRAQRQHHLQRREPGRVEARRVEDRDDLRRHQHRVRDALALDGRDEGLGVELPMNDVRRAEHERREHRRHRPVEHQRAGVQHDRLRRHPPSGGERQRVHRADEVRVLDTLGQTRRPRRVHQGEQVAGLDARAGRRFARARVQRAERMVARRFGGRSGAGQHPVDRRFRGKAPAHLVDHRETVARGHDDPRQRIAQERRESGRGEQRRQRHRGGAELRTGPVRREQLERVAEHRRHPVAARDTEAGERVRVTVDIGVELPPVEADLVLAGRAPEHDCRRVMRTLARVARGQRTEGEAVGGDRRFHHLTPAGLPDPRRR